jgi:hypothetical protein
MRLLKSAVIVSSLVLAPAAGALAEAPPLFQFEQQAKLHCPDDSVVWVNPASGVYIFPGERWYGSSRSGSFVCRREGDLAGYRPGQDPAKERAPAKAEWVRWLIGG